MTVLYFDKLRCAVVTLCRTNSFSGRVNLGPVLHAGQMELMNCSFKGYSKCVVIEIRRLGGYLPGVFGIYV